MEWGNVTKWQKGPLGKSWQCVALTEGFFCEIFSVYCFLLFPPAWHFAGKPAIMTSHRHCRCFGQYRTKSVWRLCTPSACKFPFRACFVSSRTHLACIFSEIFRENTRKSTKDFLRFSLHLSKNLTTQSAYVRYETDSHISQKCSWIHQVFTPLFVSSDEKFDDASVAQSLCGIAFIIAEKAADVNKNYKILFSPQWNNSTISYKIASYLI